MRHWTKRTKDHHQRSSLRLCKAEYLCTTRRPVSDCSVSSESITQTPLCVVLFPEGDPVPDRVAALGRAVECDHPSLRPAVSPAWREDWGASRSQSPSEAAVTTWGLVELWRRGLAFLSTPKLPERKNKKTPYQFTWSHFQFGSYAKNKQVVYNQLVTRYLHRLTLQEVEVERSSVEECFAFKTIQRPQAAGGILAQKLHRGVCAGRSCDIKWKRKNHQLLLSYLS